MKPNGHTGPPNRMRPHGPRCCGVSARPGQKPRWADELKGSSALLINTCEYLERVFIEYMAKQTKLPMWGVLGEPNFGLD